MSIIHTLNYTVDVKIESGNIHITITSIEATVLSLLKANKATIDNLPDVSKVDDIPNGNTFFHVVDFFLSFEKINQKYLPNDKTFFLEFLKKILEFQLESINFASPVLAWFLIERNFCKELHPLCETVVLLQGVIKELELEVK